MVDNHETPDGQATVNEQETLDNPEEEGHKDLESTEAPEEPETGETAEKAESEQTDQEASTNAIITETDAPLNDTVSDETEKTEDITADSEKTDNAEDTEVQEEDGAQKPTESEMSNEMLTANPENELETQEGDIASGVDGDITWRIDADGKLTVNGTGDFSGLLKPWNQYKEQVISAEVNVSGMTNASGLFSGCINMKNVDLNNFDTSNVTSMWFMFYDCSSLSSLDLSSFDTRNVTNMQGMFSECSSLSSLDLSSFDTTNVTSMGVMFSSCSSLNSLELSSFDTTNVTNMGQMFLDCSGLNSLNLSSFNTMNVIYMDDMFYGCSSLSSLDLSSFDTTNVRDVNFMGGMFVGCTDMTEIHTPRNVKHSVSLPSGIDVIWFLPDGTEVTELPQNLDHSVMITRRRNPKIITTTPDLNMDDVIRVKYVPYSYTVETNNWDEDNKVTFSIEKGELAEGLQIYPETGEIYGVPLETGEFPITVKASYSNPEYLPSYADLTLTVIDNTDNNVLNASDAGYEVEQYIGSQVYDSADSFSYVVTESADQLFISAGEYSEFIAFWLNGRKLVEGEDYTKESGSTRITIRKQTFEEKVDQDGTNTIAAEFRVGGNLNNDLKRTAQNFRMDIQNRNGQEEHNSGSGSSGRGEDSSGSSSGTGTENRSFATSVIRLVDALGNPLPDTILELHSTPQEARTDRNGIAVFAEVENGVHTLYAKNGNGTIFALKSFELLFGENTGIINDQITVKAGTAFTLNVQVDGNELKFLNLQEGDLYQVVSAATSDDTRPAIWFLLAVLSAGVILGSSLHRRRKQYAGSMQ